MEQRLVPATIFTVDDDPGADFTSIQDAVDAASPGDTIQVRPGIYNEAVVVDKRLKILGSFNPNLTAAQRTGPAAGDARNSIVDPIGSGSAFSVEANKVTISGFTIRNDDESGTDFDDDSVGINLDAGFSGAKITNNAISDQTIGLRLATIQDSAIRTRIKSNAFVNNTEDGTGTGNGIYSDAGASNVLIAFNLFAGQDVAAVNFASPTADIQTNLTVRSNRLRHDSTLAFTHVTTSVITGNVSDDSNSDGIFFGGGVVNVQVTNNTLRNGAFTGINITENFSTDNNTDNLISGNRVSGFRDAGIRLRAGTSFNIVENNIVSNNGIDPDVRGHGISLEDSSDNTVRFNTVSGNISHGIFLEDGDANRILDNVSKNNLLDGLHVDSDSTGNRIRRNTLLQNFEFDAADESTGSGTAGTANTWQGNIFVTADPPGLA